MKWTGMLACLALYGFMSGPAHTQDAKDAIQLQTVKYAGLKEVIHKNIGKVILVDFWGDFCPPCKKGFPLVVEMHKLHAKKGLAVVSVSLDDPDSRDNALRFLKKAGAEFTNLYLDEPSDFWQKKLGFAGPPCYFVFNRQGQWTKFEPRGDEPVDYPAMERFIVERLGEKQ